MTDCGFTDIEIRPFDWLHPNTPPALIPLVQSWSQILETLPFIREGAGSLLIQARKPVERTAEDVNG